MDRPRIPSKVGGVVAVLLLLLGCKDGSAPSMFRDATSSAGLDFVHSVDPTGKFPLPEVLGAGCAVFDANGDGRLDLYFTNSGRFGGEGAANALFLRGEDGKYRDATDGSGLGDRGFGMGVAVGDIDNDGDLDVYVGNYGGDALYRNEGGGKFTNITEAAGIANDKWTSSIAFLDYDADGLLDIFVVNYLVFDANRRCENPKSGRDYCGPQMFKGEADVLYRNKGQGVFEDVSEKLGISSIASNGLGLVVEDFNDDGWADVFVANDAEANHLWMNTQKGGFREEALSLGVAVNGFGVTEASMGVAAGDIDGDGDCDLFMTHLMNERNTLYVRTEYGFEDGSRASGLAAPSFPFTGFGRVIFDD
ncbi:MAG: VCBS repeat-containing protein [Planctomycetota bacterium]|nr:VCBS repeat-containing protein [Planctomycetota bacterium]